MQLTMTPAKPEVNRYDWHSWWAWWPTVCTDIDTKERRLVWREYVTRRRNPGTCPAESGVSDAFWEYKLP
jgi:hypothetical protein